jgi:hypothetical protein
MYLGCILMGTVGLTTLIWELYALLYKAPSFLPTWMRFATETLWDIGLIANSTQDVKDSVLTLKGFVRFMLLPILPVVIMLGLPILMFLGGFALFVTGLSEQDQLVESAIQEIERNHTE